MRPDRRSSPARLRERTPGVFVMPRTSWRKAGAGVLRKRRIAETKKGAAAPFSGFHLPRKRQVTQSGAGNETRTRDLNLGKVALYQLSYSRLGAAHSTRLPGGALALRCKKMSAAGWRRARPRSGLSRSRFGGVGVGSVAAACTPGRAATAGATRNRGRPILNAANVDHGEIRSGMAASLNRNAFSAATRPLMAAHRQPATQPRRYFSGFSGSLPCSALSCRQVFKGCAVAATIVVTSWVSSRARTLRQAQP